MSEVRTNDGSVPTVRAFFAGVLMGLANLVPGISGGTMILAVGLYDRFISSVADITRLKFKRQSLLFLGTLAVGLVVAVLVFSGLAVAFVGEYRWVAYSLFIGMTLGGAPELVKHCWPAKPACIVAFGLAVGLMVTLALELSGTQLPRDTWVLFLVGAVAASSMILPGISGSYILLILGMYDLVVGSLSSSALREDFGGSLAIVAPVVIGAVVGIALLSNVLEKLLAKHKAISHAALLGLLIGSVVGLYPFRQPVNAELANKPMRKAVTMLIAGQDEGAVLEKYGAEFDLLRARELSEEHAGASAGHLKMIGDALETFEPSGSHIGGSLLLFMLGTLITRRLGKRSKDDPESTADARPPASHGNAA
ncbi:MAG: putative membrane protein [Planctomycetota bacterium]|jgi:putative membrane protein